MDVVKQFRSKFVSWFATLIATGVVFEHLFVDIKLFGFQCSKSVSSLAEKERGVLMKKNETRIEIF